ncbi:MAG: hypothetical protein I3270_02570 [Candidatus Moeniiplasma glomeromycotorum]|nr:hypothetical protein [Candidatus Moeniiplasma glomeromycotorum]MCE8162569.1 hypothetical protein [Candidatus Moeniiplasma glomeromycotorum]MCE8166507.1 hypothetical protein [Candidatus Moeniiplasma glomeromycotorum]MCE8166952.1 hypothetical protein [Candidatus Moeniiplasma glomeromycotorum]
MLILNEYYSKELCPPCRKRDVHHGKKVPAGKCQQSESSKNLNLTNKTLIQELARRIEAGIIKIDINPDDQLVGLSCQNYQWEFPDGWDYPRCYREVVDSEDDIDEKS